MVSIYGSIFNLSNNLFNWKEALTNFTDFADEVCISTTTDCKDNTIELLQEYIKDKEKIKLVITNKSFNDYDFDGSLKDAALKQCSEPFCVLLDADERVRIKDKHKFNYSCDLLNNNNHLDALFIPVIDLFHSERHYKNLSQKWYIHKNEPNIGRGIVNFAKLPNGKIRHTASDTCELIYRDTGDLVKTGALFDPRLEDSEKLEIIKHGDFPIVYHLGWLDQQKRIKQSEFWSEHWNNRAGFDVNSIKTKEELDKILYFEHDLPLWYE